MEIMETKTDVQLEKKDYFALAITSFVFGVFSLLNISLLPIIVGLPMSTLGLVFGIISINSSKRKLAIAGIVLNTIGLILIAAVVVISVFVTSRAD
jgi:hypothetical protein